jgi:hypothetical protein
VKDMQSAARLLISACLVALIAGCATSVDAGAPRSSTSPLPVVEEPTASATPVVIPAQPTDLPDDVLFVITATETSPQGATASMVETVYKPIAASAISAKRLAALHKECDPWTDWMPHAAFVPVTISITDTSPAGASWTDPVAAAGPGSWVAFFGHASGGQSMCAGRDVGVGESSAIKIISRSKNADDEYGWARDEYGFYASPQSGSNFPAAVDRELTSCSIALSAYAVQTSDLVQLWPSTPQAEPPYSCRFGSSF